MTRSYPEFAAGPPHNDADAAKSTPPEPRPEHKAEEFWVFGYGSLMWRPGFRYIEKRDALLPNYARRFCIWSVRYRGTYEAPGLVLGLSPNPGGSTQGVAFRVAADDALEARAYLEARELVSAVYFEVKRPVVLLEGAEPAEAITYIVDTAHRQFADGLSLQEQAQIIAERCGPMGANCEYLFNTVAHLREMQVVDDDLEVLEALVRARLRP